MGLNFDISDDEQFKLFVVEKLTLLTEQTATLRKEFDGRKFWDNLGHTLGPTLVLLHGIAHKLGLPV